METRPSVLAIPVAYTSRTSLGEAVLAEVLKGDLDPPEVARWFGFVSLIDGEMLIWLTVLLDGVEPPRALCEGRGLQS